MLNDTQLLNHVYQSAEMGRDGILSVLKSAENPKLSQALRQQLEEYKNLQDSSAHMLQERGVKPEGISPMVKASSQVMSAMKTMNDRSATKIAEMMIQGNTMGVTKSLRVIHDYSMEDERVSDLANKLLETEQNNIEQMKPFL